MPSSSPVASMGAPLSFNPKTGLVYIPYMQLGIRFKKSETTAPLSELLGSQQTEFVSQDEHDGKSALLAWDPIAQKERWRVWHDSFWNGGTLSTAGGLIFQGMANGYLSAYDASTGERLWHFNAGLGIIAAPISYKVNGTQYVSVLVGHGGPTFAQERMSFGWKLGLQPRRLLTFALDANARLPPTAPRDFTIKPVDDPSIEINEADAAAGGGLFGGRCAMCHGVNIVSPGNIAPDLRESQIALHRDELWSVLHDGALMEQGMPRFDPLTREQVDQLYAYIRAGARQALKEHAGINE